MRSPKYASRGIHTRLVTMLGGILLASGLASADTWNTGTGGRILTSASTTKLGVGLTSTTPKGLLDVRGSEVVGSGYAGVNTPPTDGMIIQGSVGIGTTAPASGVKLDVNGTIKANLIQIKTWTMEVPDYVFQEGYQLSSLAETEKFIQKNQHLPEVPSAKDMKKDGMNLAEMNLILLKKVEELTLHVIDQEKQIQSLSSKIGK